MDVPSIQLVQNSFSKAFARKAELADRFYHHLFQVVPEARGLFQKDFFHQKEMFTTMLTSTVRSMSDQKSFADLGDRLAVSHARFGVAPAQYHAAANALIAALRDTLGDDLTREEEAAWTQAIDTLTSQMAGPGA
ncbi:globin domain-containing protein [Aliisedimentitalea scapharcae]|uniref:Globin domain-containing protein n=1 Tax=Aliisedimentitalea scapharcae TaxID=1524259 RepID=A0ABZ2XQZ0_9RHOB